MKIVVLDGYALNPGDLSWDELRQFGDVEIHDRTSEEEVVDRCADAQIVLTNKAPFSAATIAKLTSLRHIGVVATGYNIVDIAAARQAGIVVTNVPTYGTSSVAQFTIALLLELCHHIGLHSEAVSQGEWSRCADWSFWKTPQIELAGKTLGVVGFGRIGRQTAAIAAAMGMRIIANDAVEANPPELDGFRWATVDDLLAQADVVSLHCPLTAANQGMFHLRRLSRMKQTALLVNTSRGALVDDGDLAWALNNGVIAGAGLDVLSVEPPLDSNPLFTARNCIVTPHIAWATREARQRLLDTAVGNVRSFFGNRTQNRVA